MHRDPQLVESPEQCELASFHQAPCMLDEFDFFGSVRAGSMGWFTTNEIHLKESIHFKFALCLDQCPLPQGTSAF